MSIDKLKAELAPWIESQTWRTFDTRDDMGFHFALKAAFDSLGTAISYLDFKEAMEQLLEKYHPDLHVSDRIALAEKFAERVEVIGSYLQDTSS
jgi:hypothetical protein